ncbi:MAG TPA: hypothetical protein VIS73_13335 [Rhodocyclaceae bacterium]
MIALLQSLLDRLLADQAEARQRLARHTGRRLRVGVLGGAATLAIDEGGALRIVDLHGDPAADLRVTISAESLTALPAGDPLRGARIEGAADLADDFSAAARTLRFDPADWLAPFTGDIVANRIGEGLKALGAVGADALSRAEAALRDRAAADSLPLLRHAEAAGFDAELRQLFDAVESLDRRVGRLAQSGGR